MTETGYILNPDRFLLSSTLVVLVKEIANTLEKRYPGWWWTINPDPVAGVIYIYCLRLSGHYGYTMKIAEIEKDDGLKDVIEAGGQILERYGIRRGKYKRELLQGKLTDLRGDFIPDITDKKRRTQQQDRDRKFTRAVNAGVAKIVHKDIKREDGTTFRQIAVRIGGEDNERIDSTGTE